MLNRPSHTIFEEFRTSSKLSGDILDWFDEIYECFVIKNINHRMYHFTSFERVEDYYLDFFLYDKGFSTHKNLSPDAKRCVLRNWQEIYSYRFTKRGIQKYLSCITQQNISIDIELSEIRSNFIQPNSQVYGFPNQGMIDSVGTPNSSMTYIYSPEYEFIDKITINFEEETPYIQAITNYIIGLLRFELPRTDYSQKWNLVFYDTLNDETFINILIK